MDTDRPLALKGRRRSIRDLAYLALRDAIIHGHLAPGEVLSEDKLASTLDVSRTPLREALQHLYADGLIERADNGRISVKKVSLDEAAHLYAVRTVLEDLAVREAAHRMTPEGLRRLRSALERMQRDAENPVGDVAESGGDFHQIIRNIAENPINAGLIARIDVLIARYRHLSTESTQSRRHDAVAEHEAIFAALEAGDEEGAAAAVRSHVARSYQSVQAALGRLQESGRAKE